MKKVVLSGIFICLSCLLWAQTITTGAPGTPNVPQGNRSAILYEQLPADGSSVYASQEFPDFPTYNCEAADDFIVPDGETWNIETVTAFGGGWNGFIPTNVVNIVFYQDAGGLPGAVVQAYMGIDCTTQGVYPAANLVASLPTPLPMPAGHYWVSVAEVAPFTQYGQWGVNSANVITNHEALWINPAGGFGSGTTWQTAVPIWGQSHDWAFRLEGTIGGPIVPLSGWALIFGGVLIAGFVVARTMLFRRA